MIDNWGLLGHEWAVDMLRQQLMRAGARHAYLFAGPPGLGRRTLALRLAQALNCAQPPAPGEACLRCRDCRQTEAMRHPDLAVIQAEAEGGALKVEQVREARRTLSLKPYQSRYRVALFLRFHEATEGAANALLKTLEEAPAYAILILTADAPELLLPTIVSRCEVLRLRSLPLAAVEAWLVERGAPAGPRPATRRAARGVAEGPRPVGQARLIAHLSGGRPGYALRLLQTPDLLAERVGRLDDLQRLLPASRAEKFFYAEKLAKDREAMRQTLLIWLSYWRDVLLRVAGAETPIANTDRAVEIEFLAGQLSLPQARRTVSDLERAVERLERNVNARLLAEVLLLDWPRV